MPQLAWSNLSKTGCAFLIMGLGTACGSSNDAANGGSVGDGGPSDNGAAIDSASDGDLGANNADASAEDAPAVAQGGASTLAVNLGSAAGYAILAESGISSVPTCAITGNLGISPAAATFITGFSLLADSTNAFSTSPQVTGKVYAADYTAPTPSNLTTAVGDMETAFTDAAGRAPNVTGLGAGNIGGMTLSPGVYKWSTGLLIPANVTLNGSGTDVWIFQVAQDLTMSNAASVVLAGGAASKNVFWEVAGSADLGTTAHFEGTILAKTAVGLQTGASIEGRLLAQTAVTLESNAVVEPSP
jgi:Ice-binding-like